MKKSLTSLPFGSFLPDQSRLTSCFFNIFILIIGCGFFSSPAISSDDKKITIINMSDATFIVYVHIVPAGNPDWGPDRLGANDGIAPGESRSWDITWDGCKIDFQAKSILGYEWKNMGANICGGLTLTIYEPK